MNYEIRYSKLNERQKQAVNTIEGPVMVVAGPGTGKTELLSMRAANILRRTDMLNLYRERIYSYAKTFS